MGGTKGRNALFLAAAVVLSTLGGGCSFAPVNELKVFRESVTTANAAATPILDELTSTVRSETRRTTEGLEKPQYRVGGAVRFETSQAQYFTDIGDPKSVAMFRNAHAILDRLSQVLLDLAMGTNAAADAGAVEGLASELLQFAAFVPAADTAAAAAGLQALKPLLEELSKELGRRQVRQAIETMEKQKVVERIIDRLIKATPPMFDILVQAAQLQAAKQQSDASTTAYQSRVARIRLVLSNYVVLLGRVSDSWLEAVRAEKSQTSGNAAMLTERVSELRAAALATRKSFADMNAAR